MFSQIVKHKLVDKELKLSDLARLINTSHSNLSQKIKRDNFSEKEMIEIAQALDCSLSISLKEKTPE